MVIEDIVVWLGGGLLFGYIAGYAFEKLVKIAAVIIGAFILVMAFLAYKGWIDANWNVIENQTKDIASNATQQVIDAVNKAAVKYPGLLTTHDHIQITPIAGGVGFIIGFILGVRH